MSLPAELLIQIADYVTSIQTLRSLACVDRRFYTIFNCLLYERDAQGCPSAAVNWAAKHGNLKVMQKSLSYGAQIPVKANSGRPYHGEPRLVYGKVSRLYFADCPPPHPLCLAVEHGHEDIFRLLLDRGCDIDMQNPHGISLLCLAVISENLHMVRALLHRGANQLTYSDNGCSPIQIAAFHGNITITRLLLNESSQSLRNSREIKDALEAALRKNYQNIISLLLEGGVNLNTTFDNWGGTTPLIHAVEKGDMTLVQQFLRHGAEPNRRGWDGEEPLIKAVKRGHEGMVRLLVEGTGRISCTRALSLSAGQPNGNIARFLLDNGVFADFDDEDYSTYIYKPFIEEDYLLIPPLVRAVNAGNLEMVQLLVDEYAADANAYYQGFMSSKSSRREGSVLQLAIDLGHQDIEHFLRNRGAKEEVRSYFDRLISSMQQ